MNSRENTPAVDDMNVQQEAVFVRTEEVTDKKCPQCGGVMDFDPATGGLHCPYCDFTKTIDASEEIAVELDFLSEEETGNHNWGVATKTVLCKSCGAEMIYDVMQTAAECAYCGSNQVMEAGVADTLTPGGVVPFAIDKDTAVGRFQKWLKGKWFCPKAAKEQARPDVFKGVYLPYWTFDTQTTTSYTARYGIRHTRTRDGKTETYMDWSKTSGIYDEFFNDQLVIATDRHQRGFLRQIEPFNTDGALAYRPEYIAGFLSERYTLGLKDGWESARRDIDSAITSGIKWQVKKRHGADEVDSVRKSTSYSDIKYKYLLLPIWISSFKYNGKQYQFMINGQTGKVGGKSPISPWRVLVAIIIGLLVLGLLFFLMGGCESTPDYRDIVFEAEYEQILYQDSYCERNAAAIYRFDGDFSIRDCL